MRQKPIFDHSLQSFKETIRPNAHSAQLIRAARAELAAVLLGDVVLVYGDRGGYARMAGRRLSGVVEVGAAGTSAGTVRGEERLADRRRTSRRRRGRNPHRPCEWARQQGARGGRHAGERS